MLLRQGPSGPTNKLPSFPGGLGTINVGAVASIDFSKGPAQQLGLTQNANVSVLGLTQGQPTWMQLNVTQIGGGAVPTFVGAKTPGGLPLAVSAANNATDIISLFWDGNVLYAALSGLAFA